ncbi:MAG: hypothetical protein MZU95_11400 [Desulfomicrobium escambiense]|nr:hypothetical protein [Desulfomicrobium escambiense]
MELTIYVNRQELVHMSVHCSQAELPRHWITSTQRVSFQVIGDVLSMRVCEDDSLADVMLSNPEYELPTVRTLSHRLRWRRSFQDYRGQRVESGLVVTPQEVLSLME